MIEKNAKQSLGMTGALRQRLLQQLKEEVNSDNMDISRVDAILSEIKTVDIEISTYRYLLGYLGD
jgi:hypothetical protein